MPDETPSSNPPQEDDFSGLLEKKPKPSPAPVSVLLGLGLLACFFLPWIKISLGITVSGFQLQGEKGLLWLWIQPITAALVAVASCFERQKPLEVLAGLVPFVFLALFFFDSKENVLPSLEAGAWGGLLTGALLALMPGASPKG